MPAFVQPVVLGLGASGVAAARLLRREASRVTVLDANDTPLLRRRARRLAREGVAVRLGAASLRLPEADLCVVSPGIPVSAPWIRAALAEGVPCVSELELGWSRLPARTLAVTGSNGKSTWVKWVVDSIRASGATVRAAGNYGVPVSRLALERRVPEWVVLEVSSFQLETVEAFQPDIGVLLNVFPNHVDRHGSMAAYRAAKSRLFSRMTPKNVAIVPARLRVSVARKSRCGARWETFGTGRAAGFRWAEGRVWRHGTCVLDLRETPFDNEVLGPSAAAAAAALTAAALPLDRLRGAAQRFRPLPHRMERVAEAGGICFIDDSKSTNLAALSAGVRQTSGPVRLLAGGLDKGDDPATVKELLAYRCRGVYILGSSAKRWAEAWADAVMCEDCGTLEKAFSRAVEDAAPGETVLLSPGCASFDQFTGFDKRGAAFQEYVRAWIESAARPRMRDAVAGRKRRRRIG